MSSSLCPIVPQHFWDHDAANLPDATVDWLLPGFIARGNITLLTSMWKAGKTTLLAHLLARRAAAQPLFGLPVAPGKTAVISEEPRSFWIDRCRQFPFGGSVCVFAQPFVHLPSLAEWQGLLDQVGRLQGEHGIDLLVVDSLTHFLRGENDKKGILDLLMPVRALSSRGVAVLLTHHPRRAGGLGVAGRGHGALHAEVDISIEMRHAAGNLDSRARRFFCLSRHAATPRHFLFELNAEGTDYTALAVPEEDEGFQQQWDVLRGVLEDAEQKLTRQDILDEWPADFAKPAACTLWTWLKRAVTDQLIQVEGTGRKNDPLRYWLAATEERWRREQPLYDCMEKLCRDSNYPFPSLRARKRQAAEEVKQEDIPVTAANIWPPGSPLE